MLVFKQWLYSPNKRSTAKVLNKMINYIATREGVELSEEIDVLNDGNKFSIYAKNEMNYIATREGAEHGKNQPHGLFGKIPDMNEQGDIANLSEAKKYISILADKKITIYNAVISFDRETATRKGYTNRQAFEELIQSNINDIARNMGIEPRTLEYAAAVHIEESHPHVHLMYWDKEQAVTINFVKAEKSNDIRKALTKKVFAGELHDVMARKDKHHKSLIEKISSKQEGILKNPSNVFKGMTLSEVYGMAKNEIPKEKILNRREAQAKVMELNDMLSKVKEIIKSDYKKGALKYQYMPENIKSELDNITSFILSVPQIAKEYSQFFNAAKEQAMIYGGKDNVDRYTEKAKEAIYKEIGNKVLEAIKGEKHVANNTGGEVASQSSLSLLQSVLNLVTDHAYRQKSQKPPTNKNKLKYMSAIEKAEMRKRLNESNNSFEWGE